MNDVDVANNEQRIIFVSYDNEQQMMLDYTTS